MKTFSNYFEILDHHAELRGNKVAIYYEQKKITYSQLNENVTRFGNILKNLGIKPGEKVIIALPDCPDFIYAILGTIKIGAMCIPVSPYLKEIAYEFILKDSEASAFIAIKTSEATMAKSPHMRFKLYIDDENYEELFEKSPSEPGPCILSEDEISFIFYSSGSTGIPKGIPHRHSDMVFVSRSYGGQILNITEDDILFSASKLSFMYGFVNSLLFPFYSGVSTILFPHKSTPAAIFKVISDYKPTIFFSVPTLYNIMLKMFNEDVSLNSIRLCISAGEALPAGIYHEWKKLTGLEILDGYGTTETTYLIISNRSGDVRPGSSGFIISPYEAKIVGEDGLPVPSGQPGNLLIRGKSISPLYWNLPEKTKEMMLEDGWFKTGDIFIEENGCFTHQGRGDDMFKVSGEWVSPVVVEHVICEHPSVMECAVTWRKIEGLANSLAYVVLNKGFEKGAGLSKDIRIYALERLPEYMCPVQIVFCETIPRTETGKVQRFKIRSQ
jgi:benzoate-CoA ligase